MVDKNIFQMDALPAVADDTMIPVIATNVDTSTNNKMSMTQVAQYVSNYIASLTRTVYVGTGSQFEYQNISQAWGALGSPLNVVVCTEITEDSDIKLSDTNSYLSITHASNVTVNWLQYQIFTANPTRATLKINGSFSIWRREYGDNKALIDFKTAIPENAVIEISDLIDFDESNHSSSTPFIIQGQPVGSNFCRLKNVTLNLNNNATSTNELIDADIENLALVCNSGRESDFVLSLEGTSKINGLKALGDFRSITTLATINKYSTYENVWNLATGQVAIVTSGGHGANLYGVTSLLNITMSGDEVSAISPKVVNANNCNYTFIEGDSSRNSSGSIVNSDVIAVDNRTLRTGNFKFSNCQIPSTLSWTEGAVVQFSNCNYQKGYTINTSNTVMVNNLAGLSEGGSSENIKVDGGNGSIIIATQGNADFDDPTIGTDDVQEGFNKVIT
jgi:hypothetical protein